MLQQLDHIMRSNAAEGGLSEGIWDRRVLAWLDRLYDVSLSEWLTEKAPAALQFREREFQKGYDPVIGFARFYGDLLYAKTDDGMQSVFLKPEDRLACHQLIEAVYDDASPLHPERKQGWCESLRNWYWFNRSHFRYDPQKHRLVLAPTSATQGS